MPKRTRKQIFLDTLRLHSGTDRRPIGNKRLRQLLGWDEGRYSKIKSKLLAEKAITKRRGKGGSVRLAEASVPKASAPKALKVFVSYSHLDEKLKAELLKHLEPLKRLGLIEEWQYRKLEAGEEWKPSISSNLENADIVLLLVSIDFINSKYCYDIELARALELHEQKKAVVVPVILRECLWQSTPFAKLQAVPTDAKAVSTWDSTDAAFADVAKHIQQLAQKKLGSG
jgi:hypothetical protein